MEALLGTLVGKPSVLHSPAAVTLALPSLCGYLLALPSTQPPPVPATQRPWAAGSQPGPPRARKATALFPDSHTLACFLVLKPRAPDKGSGVLRFLCALKWGRRLCRGPEPGHCCLKGWQQLLRRSQLQSRTQGPPRPQNQESREELVPARILKIRPVTGEGPSLFRDVLWVTCGILCCQSEAGWQRLGRGGSH